MSDVNFIMRETSERVNHTLKRLHATWLICITESIREDRRKRDVKRCEERIRCFYYIYKGETRNEIRLSYEVRIFL